MTPSLGCDSPLDVRLKSALMADLLTLVGVAAVDPILRPQSTNHRSAVSPPKKMTSVRTFLYFSIEIKVLQTLTEHSMIQYRRVHSAEMLMQKKKNIVKNSINKSGLTGEQQRIVASARAQFERRGGFVRIFPSPKSWEIYSQYLG